MSFTSKTILIIFILGGFCFLEMTASDNYQGIMPWPENPRYWQYKGEPVLLLGGTDSDNLFQMRNPQAHLYRMKAAGGNYVRNTMSDRDPGDQRPFAMTNEDKYDLNLWNETYWILFENLLKYAKDLEIIVQIELWDRHDHYGEAWLSDPYNPKNNINYTYSEAGLDTLYPSPSNYDLPFFSTIPELDSNIIMLNYQEKFIEKLLSISMKYDNVLYCIDNETTGIIEWAFYWSDFIKSKYQGKEVYITQMWNDHDMRSEVYKGTLDFPDRFNYLDISQNSHKTGQSNWDNAQFVHTYNSEKPRPVNSIKIYGSDNDGSWLERGVNASHALQTFYRNILGGFAASRFHRPPHGLGLSQPSVFAIMTVRKIEEYVKIWEVNPSMELLPGISENQAYIASAPGEKYILYLPSGGKVNIDLTGNHAEYVVRWIQTGNAQWGAVEDINGGVVSELDSKSEESCIAVIIKK